MLPIAIVSVLAALLVAASSGDEWAPSAAGAAHAAERQGGDGAGGVNLKLMRSPFGRVVFADSFAQYLFTKDGRRSRCYGDCAEAWPPLLADGRVVAGKGIKKSLLGAKKRRDGSKQVTYDGSPLYGYEHDPRGEVLCHDVREFGGRWYAVLKSGERAP
ncbi:MAG: COG4315 family predicted lipoprotein [Solirubrobacterales bacterium]